jgi:uncharacterized membrane protein YhiD involved in acid resistance
MTDEFLQIQLLSLTANEIILNLAISLICGYAVAKLYKSTQQGNGNGKSFFQSLVLLSLVTSMVIMIIGDSLARAFGLVGAMSIIRFRTAVKDTVDILYIFFALATGLAAGAGAHRIAILGTVMIGGVAYVLAHYSKGGKKRFDYLVQFESEQSSGDDAYPAVLKHHCQSYAIVTIKSIEEGGVAVTCSVQFSKDQEPAALVDALHDARGITKITCFYDDREY